MYCSDCGKKISDKARNCPSCGCPAKQYKSNLTAFLLCIFLGTLGAHRFYVGKTGTAIVQLLLCWSGITEIWAIIDLINIICGNFTDSENKKIKVW